MASTPAVPNSPNQPMPGFASCRALRRLVSSRNFSGSAGFGGLLPRTTTALRRLAPITAPMPVRPLARLTMFMIAAKRTRFSPAGPPCAAPALRSPAPPLLGGGAGGGEAGEGGQGNHERVGGAERIGARRHGLQQEVRRERAPAGVRAVDVLGHGPGLDGAAGQIHVIDGRRECHARSPLPPAARTGTAASSPWDTRGRPRLPR